MPELKEKNNGKEGDFWTTFYEASYFHNGTAAVDALGIDRWTITAVQHMLIFDSQGLR